MSCPLNVLKRVIDIFKEQEKLQTWSLDEQYISTLNGMNFNTCSKTPIDLIFGQIVVRLVM